MKTLIQHLGMAVLAVGVLAAPATADVIYDNTTTFKNAIAFDVAQLGNEVQAAGSARYVDDLQIGVNAQGSPGTANLQAFLYANDGSGGAPGTMLWESALMTAVPITVGNDLISFVVPDVKVPDAFTWTLQISNSQPLAGISVFDPPTTGAILHSWFGTPGSWTSDDGAGADGHFMARITAASSAAVPEPASIVSLSITVLIGFLAWASLRRRSATAASGL